MTFAEVAAIMLGGGSSGGAKLPMPNYIRYYDYQTSVSDYEYTGSSYVYDESRTVPANSIVIQYYIQYNSGGYRYEYHIYQLIIEDIDTTSEEVVGIVDLQTNKEYRFQFNVRGGR